MSCLLGPTKSLEMRACLLTPTPLVAQPAARRRLALYCGGGCCGGEDKETGGCCFGVASLCCRRVGLSAEVPAAPAGHLIL